MQNVLKESGSFIFWSSDCFTQFPVDPKSNNLDQSNKVLVNYEKYKHINYLLKLAVITFSDLINVV
ncbi:MAG: hypothetical protein CVU08_08155 [Bacteroidetes bacterium HGW-Bacteroidetes-3]|nr:MAG: hypothetical protein CVU08_08155 [Bacteroidetes bacterium HGW-Bacteroidetes-3]